MAAVMSRKLYFDASETDPEQCHTMDHFKDQMAFDNVSNMTLIEAKPAYGSGMFWCKEFGEVGDVGESCGKQCRAYKPRNGKNGRCAHSSHLYEPSNKIITIENKSLT
jgi:hypothetical protein